MNDIETIIITIIIIIVHDIGLFFYFYNILHLKGIFRMAKQAATMMGHRSGEVRGPAADQRHIEALAEKAYSGLMSKIPLSDEILKATGLTTTEAMELLTDPKIGPTVIKLIVMGKDLMQGLGGAVGGLVETVKGKKSGVGMQP